MTDQPPASGGSQLDLAIANAQTGAAEGCACCRDVLPVLERTRADLAAGRAALAPLLETPWCLAAGGIRICVWCGVGSGGAHDIDCPVLCRAALLGTPP